MKNLFPLFSLVLVLFATSCETDFQLEGEWKDIPVVYSFLSEQDTAYYVRVERAFLEIGGNAVDIAQIPDSIYYAPGEVTVTLTSGNETETLTRVSGDDEGYPRQEGDFAATPNVLYKLPLSAMQLTGGDDFTIAINRDGEITAEASSLMVEEIKFTQIPANGLNVGNYNSNNKVVWRPTGENAAVFDVRVVVQYNETDPNTPGGRLDKEVVWILDQDFKRVPSTSTQNIPFEGEGFYQFLANEIDPIDNGNRQFERLFFEVTGAGSEIGEYLNIANANIGITSSQAVPVYSNVDGGVGVVSSRYFVRSDAIGLNSISRDSLYNGVHTAPLKFVP